MLHLHPGEILLEDFLSPMKITPHALAIAIHVPANRITEIIKGKRGITLDTAVRLGKYFNVTAESFMNMQIAYDKQELINVHLADYNSIQPITSRVENVSK